MISQVRINIETNCPGGQAVNNSSHAIDSSWAQIPIFFDLSCGFIRAKCSHFTECTCLSSAPRIFTWRAFKRHGCPHGAILPSRACLTFFGCVVHIIISASRARDRSGGSLRTVFSYHARLALTFHFSIQSVNIETHWAWVLI